MNVSSLLPSALLLALLGCGSPSPPGDAASHSFAQACELPFDAAEAECLADPVWNDGLAELAFYDAERTIYGRTRQYEARFYTNVQRMDASLSTKDTRGRGVEVFKQHRSERIPTTAYDYDFSTVCFLERDSLQPFKLTAASQEDCGATFRQLWRAGGDVRWFQSSYLPSRGIESTTFDDAPLPYTLDELPLVLRAAPADLAAGTEFDLELLPELRGNGSVQPTPTAFRVTLSGSESFETQLGDVAARRFDVIEQAPDAERRTYWFALEQSEPWLGVLLGYEGPLGERLRLSRFERSAYWDAE